MATLAQLEPDVAARLNDPGNVFYSSAELYDALAEGAFEASLITGEPEVSTAQVTLPAGTNVVQIPDGLLCVLKVVGAGGTPVLGITMWDLDSVTPGWEKSTGSTVQYWFPLGFSSVGIYPQLSQPAQVTFVGLAVPVPDGPNYTGAEQLPFEASYNDALCSYASHAARLKQGGVEFARSIAEYQRFLYGAGALSRWAIRTGSLRFASGLGFGLGTSQKEVG